MGMGARRRWRVAPLGSAFLMIADVGSVGLGVGAEVAEADERARARVLDDDAGSRRFGADEDFVLGHLAEADHGRRFQPQLADAATALDGDPAVGSAVLDRALGARFDRQLF